MCTLTKKVSFLISGKLEMLFRHQNMLIKNMNNGSLNFINLKILIEKIILVSCVGLSDFQVIYYFGQKYWGYGKGYEKNSLQNC